MIIHHKTKHQDANDRFLGYRGSGYYDDSNGLTQSFNDQYQLDVIGTSQLSFKVYCLYQR
jgi:hypothetical protein